jgi:hypothetical protein
VRVTKRCAGPGCRKQFELTAQQIHNGAQKRYCGAECRANAAEMRDLERRGGAVCGACGGSRRLRGSYGLLLCGPCRTVAYRSCWRKVPFPTAEAATKTDRSTPLFAYLCRLCSAWHATHIDAAMSDTYEDLLGQIGTYLRSVDFNLEAARGWSLTLRTPPETVSEV